MATVTGRRRGRACSYLCSHRYPSRLSCQVARWLPFPHPARTRDCRAARRLPRGEPGSSVVLSALLRVSCPRRRGDASCPAPQDSSDRPAESRVHGGSPRAAIDCRERQGRSGSGEPSVPDGFHLVPRLSQSGRCRGRGAFGSYRPLVALLLRMPGQPSSGTIGRIGHIRHTQEVRTMSTPAHRITHRVRHHVAGPGPTRVADRDKAERARTHHRHPSTARTHREPARAVHHINAPAALVATDILHR